ncbi:MAG: LamG domain-containing protein [Planctomycetota bacterium]
MDYLTDDARYAIPERRIDVPHIAALPPITVPDQEQVLILDGHLDCLRVMNEQFRVPNGPLTIECWFNAESFGDRVGLIAKTEYSEYGIFVSDGRPNFSIHLDGRYAEAQSADSMLRTDVWHHIAGVYDEQEVRLYVDGQLIDTVRRAGRRTPNRLPIFIGADVDRHGQPTSFFDGAIDAVRVSTTARYDGDSFVPARRLETDDHTQILLNMDARVGPWVYDNSTNHAHALIEGDTRIQSPTR